MCDVCVCILSATELRVEGLGLSLALFNTKCLHVIAIGYCITTFHKGWGEVIMFEVAVVHLYVSLSVYAL